MKKNPPSPMTPAHEYTSEQDYKLACEQVGAIDDIELQCRKSGARYLPAEKSIIIDYLNRFYRISLPGCEVTSISNDGSLALRDKLLILHYFNRASGKPLSGNIISFKEIPEGANHYADFAKRAIEPVFNNFKDRPRKLMEAAAILGGHKFDTGDIAVTLYAFPYVHLAIVLERGDKASPPAADILFDSTVTDYLPVPDIVILCEVIAGKLARLAKTGGGTPG